jgi:hypothetical protein
MECVRQRQERWHVQNSNKNYLSDSYYAIRNSDNSLHRLDQNPVVIDTSANTSSVMIINRF